MIKYIPSVQYHADDCGTKTPSLSSGLLKIILRGNMEHVRLAHPRLNKNYLPGNRTTFSVGTAAHDLILEAGSGKIEVIDPELYPSKQGAIPKGWTNDAIRLIRDEAFALGKTPILKNDYADVERMAQAAFKAIADEPDLNGLNLAKHGKAEQTVIWQDEKTFCRARPDWLDNDNTLMIDLKTTSAISPEQWERSYLAQMGYDLQQEFYCRGVEAVTGTRPRWLWLVQQDFYPFSCWFCEPSASMQEVARIKVNKALALWQTCLAADVWPSWPKGVRQVESTPWQLAEAEEIAAELEIWNKDALGAREAFMFGSVKDDKSKIGTLEEFDK
jgi:hypothetical protein